MSSQPTLALLIPTYNAAGFLPRLLDSAKRQTERFDEIWVYDDCSTDNTASVAQALGAQVLRGDVNRGCSYGKNALAAAATATWIHFHDADDELFPNFVSLRCGGWKPTRRMWCSFPTKSGMTRPPCTWAIEDLIPQMSSAIPDLMPFEQINPFCGLYRREAFQRAGGYDEDPLVLYNEDVAMHIRLAFEGLSFAADTEVCVINHRRLGSMSAANRSKCLRAQYHVMRKAAQHIGASKYYPEISSRLWPIAAGLASQLDWGTADDATRLAVRLTGLTGIPPGRLFRALCQISPCGALRAREWLIRLLKPAIRQGYPEWHKGPTNRQQLSSDAPARRPEPLT